jgi:hypothetical protein
MPSLLTGKELQIQVEIRLPYADEITIRRFLASGATRKESTRTYNAQPAIPNAPVHVIQRMQPKTSEGPGMNLADAVDAKLNTS